MDTKRIAKQSNTLLNKHGKDVVITTFTTSTVYDPATGTNVVTSTDQTVKGLVFEWGGPNTMTFGQTVIKDTLIQQGDLKLMLSPFDTSGTQTIIPKIGDIALVFNKLYTIIEPIKPLHPDGILLLIECNIRGVI